MLYFRRIGYNRKSGCKWSIGAEGQGNVIAFELVFKLTTHFSSMLRVWKRFYVSISKISFDVKLVCPPRPLSIKEIDFTSSSAINANRKLFFSREVEIIIQQFSERSVQAIKTGFQAVVGKRSRLRTAAAAAAPK